MVKIDGERVVAELREFAQIGAYKTGVHRPPLTEDDLKARAWLMDRMEKAGLSAKMDGLSNVIGRSPKPRAVLVASHSETQPMAGWLDGVLGVVYGLEIARCLKEKSSRIGIDVGSWFDEEMWYGYMLGSRMFCGLIDESEIDRARHRDTGSPLRDDLKAHGFDKLPFARMDAQRYVAYMEAHIEQGARLESRDLQIGIVTDIVGGRNYLIRAHGEQNHAGATQMALHKDAGLALCRLRIEIARRFPELAGPLTVWTSGFMRFDPGIMTVIPGQAEMQFQFRDTDSARLDRLDALLHEIAKEIETPCRIEIETHRSWPAANFDPKLQAALEAAAKQHAPGKYMHMHSAAGHDAQNFALCIPSVMMFVPSIAGVSHHWTEDTKEEDIVMGCQVFASAVEQVIEVADAN